LAVCDVNGGIYNAKGLNIALLESYVSETGRVEDFPGSENISSQEILELPCDVLIPAALGNQIHQGNVARLKCKMIVEAANGPTSPEADLILNERGVKILPDILANAGGVTVSYFEWVQGLMHLFWSENEVNQRLEQIMGRACDQVFSVCEETKLRPRMAALRIGIGRLAEAKKLRGLYP
jgi:glutamate dehydrogenase (NAD(P)+)